MPTSCEVVEDTSDHCLHWNNWTQERERERRESAFVSKWSVHERKIDNNNSNDTHQCEWRKVITKKAYCNGLDTRVYHEELVDSDVFVTILQEETPVIQCNDIENQESDMRDKTFDENFEIRGGDVVSCWLLHKFEYSGGNVQNMSPVLTPVCEKCFFGKFNVLQIVDWEVGKGFCRSVSQQHTTKEG